MAEENPDAVAAIVERYGGDRDMLIPMMQDVQAECGYLPKEHLVELARALGVPLSRVFGIATFYASFRLMPKGEHTIQLCMGTVCFLKGADKISRAITEEFDLVAGGTSPDGKFTFSPVNCVGACALAPVMVLDGEYHGGLDPDSAVGLLRGVAAGAGEGAHAAGAEGEAAAGAQVPAAEGRAAAGAKSGPATRETGKRRKAGRKTGAAKKAAEKAGKKARKEAPVTRKVRRKTAATKKLRKGRKK